jgi:hypothetical protein
MSSIYKYLDLVSQSRNRNIYPNSSDFVAVISYGGATNVNQALDPISNSYPSVVSNVQAGSTTTQIVLDSVSSNIPNFYINRFLQLGIEYRKISNYDNTTKTATVDIAYTTAPLTGTIYYIRDGIPIFSSNLVAGSNQNIVNLGFSAIAQDSYYDGYFIYFTSGPNTGVAMVIIQYQGSTRLAVMAKALLNIPGATDSYDILQYTKDSYHPLVYSGTTGFNQPVCYSIELLNLTIPNQVIKTGYGGTLDKYPYLYLYLYNEGVSHSNNILYTNNPNALSVMFKIPLGINLNTETFFTLKDAKMINVCKFNPNQSIHFKLTLPNGDPIVFKTDDNISPLPPNPLLQISGTFAIRRIDGDMSR